MKMGKRILSLLLCFVMVASMAVTGVGATDRAGAAGEDTQWIVPKDAETTGAGGADNVVEFSGGSWSFTDSEEETFTQSGDIHGAQDLVEVIVVLEEEPLIKAAASVDMAGDMAGYMATAAAGQLEQKLLDSHEAVRSEIAALCGGTADTQGYDYTAVLNGFSMTMPYGKIAEAEALEGVRYIRESRVYSVPEDQSSYDLAMANSTGMIGSDVVNDMSFNGADGAGTVVAILDTGIAEGHDAFSVEPDAMTAAYSTVSDLQAVMNTTKLSSGLTSASDAWVSGKIPYAFNYADMTVGGYSTAQPHGTHVAGIIAGNNGEDFFGVAPNAQLLIMKVFDEQGSTSDAALDAGLDDAVKLGADSINMSLGSTAGFYYDRGNEDEAYNNCWDAGVNLLIAAGNEYTNAFQNQYGNNLAQADSVDNAAVASPSTSYSALSVASVNNTKALSCYFRMGQDAVSGDDSRTPFSQAINAGSYTYYDVFGSVREYDKDYISYPYVYVGGYGEESDYVEAGFEAADALTGKFVLVNRGSTTFEDKATVAKAHGAKGIIFINNVEKAGAFSPAFNNYVLPSCGVSLEDGELLKNAEEKYITFGPAAASQYWFGIDGDKTPWIDTFPSADAYTMSDFSSWGPAPTLAIKPEISAPGGNIISSVIGGGYESMSGTSMATPHMAGVAALVRSYVRSQMGIVNTRTIRNITENLVMSTAVPGTNDDGSESSPRQQGAGLVNVKNAVTTKAYLSTEADADGVTRPKAEMGSSDSGSFRFSFLVNNISDEDLTFTLGTTSLTEGIVEQDGVKFSDQVSKRLSEDDFTVSYSGADVTDNTVTVAAGQSTTVTVDLSLSDAYMTELFRNFKNGNFCEGYVYLTPAEGQNEGVTLVLPYLGYVGDWATAGVVFEGDMNSNFSLGPTQFATANVMGSGIYLGEDPAFDGNKSYNYNRLAFSPKIGGDQQYLAMQLGVRRNLTDFEVSITNKDGEKVWGLASDYLRKTFFYNGYGIYRTQIIAEGWNGRLWNEQTGAYDGDYAPAGEYYTLTLSGYAGQQDEEVTTVSYPIWLDKSAPVVSDLRCYQDEADGKFKLAFQAQDDHFIRHIELHDSTDSWALTYTAENFKDIEGQNTASTVVMDLDDLCQFLADNGLNPGRVKMYVYDYSMNYSVTYIDLGPQYLSLSNATVALGDTLQMEYRVLPARLADTLKLAWSTSDDTVASVDENGVVTGLKKGQCVITATADSGLSASANLTVGDETLKPQDPEMPDPNPQVDYPSPEVAPNVWNTSVKASAAEELNSRFEVDGLWYKVTGADTVQLIKNPNVANAYSASYPDAPAELVIPETVTNAATGKTYTVTTIGYRAFYMTSQLTKVTLPGTIRVIGDSAFQVSWGTPKITELNLPEGLEEIGANAFYGIQVDFKLPNSLKRIGESAFAHSGITEVHFGPNIEFVEKRAFNFCKKLTKAEVIPQTQDTEGLYLYCDNLADVTIADGVERLPENCFFDCFALQSIVLPDSVKELGQSVFYGCDLSSLDFLNTGSITTLGEFCFADNDNLHDIVIPDSVTYVGANQFFWCKYVKSITFGEKVAYVGTGTMSTFFIDPSVERVVPEVRSATAGAAVRRSGFVGSMTRDGMNFDVYCGSTFVQDGITYMPISATEVQVTDYNESTVFGSVTIPETVTCEGDETTYTVTSIADSLFKQKYNITEIHLPDTINTVGERAFDQIHGLNYINIPKSLTTITGIQAFGYGGWDNLEAGEWQVDTLYVPGTLRTWNQCAFSGNKYETAVLGEGLEMVGSYGISNSNNLTTVEMADSVKYLKNNAFSSCTSLENVTLPEGLEYIGNQAFQGDPLKTVEMSDTVKYVGTQAFESLKYDYSTSPATVTYVGAPEIDLGTGVTGLGWNAFYKDAKVTAVLGSQQNLLVERCDFVETPGVCWDGKTDIPAGDYSVVPEGVEVVVSGDVRIDGTLIVNGKVRVPYGNKLVLGDDAVIENPDNVIYEECKHEKTTESVIPATATSDGLRTVTCDICGKVLVSEKIPATDRDCPSKAFKDLDTTAWYHEYVDYVLSEGIMVGNGNGTFGPNNNVTRAQMVTLLYGLAGRPSVDSSKALPFADVSADAWYANALRWAYQNGIAAGTSATAFSPNANVTREQMVSFLARYAKLAGKYEEASADLSKFSDGASVSSYAAESMEWAIANGFISGTGNGKLDPKATATRAQIAVVVTKYSQKLG